jgi:hypothetical protein
MASVTVDASNLAPSHHHVTFVSVTGFGFTAAAAANIGLLSQGGRVVGHAVVTVLADGSFQHGFLVKPLLQCDATVRVIVNDTSGATVEASGNVLCDDLPRGLGGSKP